MAMTDEEMEKKAEEIDDKWKLRDCYDYIEKDHKGEDEADVLFVIGMAEGKLGDLLKRLKDRVLDDDFVLEHYKSKNSGFILSFFKKYCERTLPTTYANFNTVSWYMAAARAIELIKGKDTNSKELLELLLKKKVGEEVSELDNVMHKLIEALPNDVKTASRVEGRLDPYAIMLYVSGYNPIKFLGRGGNGEVWEVEEKSKHYAVKVLYDSSGIKEEELSASRLMTIFKGNDKAKRYIMNSEIIADGRYIKSDLAAGDLTKDSKKGPLKVGKTIRSLIDKSIQASKSIEILHKAGFSHNDVKPENFLKLINSNVAQVVGKKRKNHVVKLSDFGTVTEISNPGDVPKSYTAAFVPSESEFKKTDEKSVSRRDVYALGVTFMYFMLKRTSISMGGSEGNKNEVVKYLVNNGAEKTCNQYKIHEIYSGTDKENIVLFLGIVYDMIRPKYGDCIDISEVLRRVKQLKSKWR